jgi:hypothetical protein
MQEAEFRRITVSGQPKPKKKKMFRRAHLNGKKADMVLHTCHPSYSGKLVRGLRSRQARAKSKTLSPK